MDDRVGQEILEAISHFSNKMDERFSNLEERVRVIETQMVTKDYLDRKMEEMRGDVVDVDRKDSALVEKLHEKDVIDTGEARGIIGMSPFPNRT